MLRFRRSPAHGSLAALAASSRARSGELAWVSLIVVVLGAIAPAAAADRTLSFPERVAAEREILRVYHSHQDGETRTFDDAVPQTYLEGRVDTYLRQSAALADFWQTPITSEMLRKEWVRIVQSTRFPARLREIRDALGSDPVLIEECFVRPILVDRLARGFFASDERIHGAQRREAATLIADLRSGRIDILAVHPRRTLALVRGRGAANLAPAPEGGAAPDPLRVAAQPVEVGQSELAELRARWPREVGRLGNLVEDRDALSATLVLDEGPEWVKVAVYRVEKVSWDAWWQEHRSRWDPATVEGARQASEGPSFHAPSPVDQGASRSDQGNVESASSLCIPSDTWDNGGLADPPEPRTGHATAWTGSLMIVWGGFTNSGTYLASGARYDPLTNVWTQLAALGAPSARGGATAVWTGSRVVVWGGFTEAGLPLATGGRYDPATDSWQEITATGAPSARSAHTAVWANTRMIVWGGAAADGSALATGGQYDPEADAWTAVSTSGAAAARRWHTAVWTGSRMIVWGGMATSGLRLQTGGQYDPISNGWTTTAVAAAPTARSSHTAVWLADRMIVWGGSTPATTGTGGRYDPSSDSWSSLSSVGAPAARSGHTAVAAGSSMIVWGGSSSTALLNSGGRYDPVADTWVATTTTNAPSGRYGHQTVWTGALMLVWGGSVTGTGGRYDPASDSWTPTALPTGPEYRSLHATVWTGSVMVVWGGFSGTATGGRYDPIVDSWAATSMVGAPSPRWSPEAVWTGSLMLVVGGASGGAQYDPEGGRYDPLLDIWTPLPSDIARESHGAVWSGSKMIVWGGARVEPDFIHVTYFDDGAAYDPVKNLWTPISSVGRPTARADHSLVWADTKAIVWGGTGPGGYLADGSAYDPATDSWAPIPPPDLLGRVHHVAAWTGSEMLVWGGHGGQELGDGARYDPQTYTWQPISPIDAPEARGEASGVWTGRELIVWGGRVSPNYLQTGGRYDPGTDTWTATSLTNAPLPRAAHSGVWAGNLMIIWGGEGVPTYAGGTGGRYSPDGSSDWDLDGFTPCTGDCDDSSGAIYPGAPELCDNQDNDCDGAVDGFMTLCGQGVCRRNGTCAGGVDSCVPGQASAEICDGLDDDCDGAISPAESDADGDGVRICQGDCDDANPMRFPAHPEVCDGIDNDCNGVSDDEASIGCDDHDPCNGVETCGGVNGCQPGTPPDCDDGNPCTVDACDSASGCLSTAADPSCREPKGQGYYKHLCRGDDPEGGLTDEDARCVGATATFVEVASVPGMCDRLEPDPTNSKCEQAEAQFLATLLNRCDGRLSDDDPVASPCVEARTVGAAIAEVDALLSNASRTRDDCVRAQCASEAISSGGAPLLSIDLTSDGDAVLTWVAPAGVEVAQSAYEVWRRLRGPGPFFRIAIVCDPLFVDAESGGEAALDYEVTARPSPPSVVPE